MGGIIGFLPIINPEFHQAIKWCINHVRSVNYGIGFSSATSSIRGSRHLSPPRIAHVQQINGSRASSLPEILRLSSLQPGSISTRRGLKHMLNEVRNYVRLGIKQCPKFIFKLRHIWATNIVYGCYAEEKTQRLGTYQKRRDFFPSDHLMSRIDSFVFSS
jgi:hypothetical protein